MDENIPPPKNFRYFLFLAKEDPDIDVSQIFYQGNRLVMKTSTCTSRSDPTLSARCDESQLLLGILRMDAEVTNRGNTHGSIIPCVMSGLIPPVLHILLKYVQQGYPHIGFLKY